ncbi:MAG: chondroitin 4-sulfotransferase 11 [Candidatus Azotimanducaceae bacterium]|jgi:chondroitin 4-sulfotransferase 11
MQSRKIQLLKEKYLQSFVFIHINKTAGSSIQEALAIPHEHRTALEKIDGIGLKSWEKKFTFTFVRNVWDKVVSHYYFRVRTNQTRLKEVNIDFKTWVKASYRDQDPRFYDNPKMFMPQVDWICDETGKMLVQYVGRFENLDSDFKFICKSIGRTSVQLPHSKASSRGDYRSYYDDTTAEIVAKWFEADIKEFLFQFDSAPTSKAK